MGLAYLEILVNELCSDVTNYKGIKAGEKKIEKILTELRELLVYPANIKRTKIINIYWRVQVNF